MSDLLFGPAVKAVGFYTTVNSMWGFTDTILVSHRPLR